MEEKRYPVLDEEENVGMCCEPVAAVPVNSNSVNGIAEVHDWIDDLDWDRFPSHGPFSEEEAIARIDAFEERLEKGQVKWYSSEEVDRMLYEKFPWLR
jgi:hypothetical protein